MKEHNNTLKEYYADIEMSRVHTILKYIMAACHNIDVPLAIYAVGNCHKRKAEIDSVSNEFDAEIKVNTTSRWGVLSLLPIPTPRIFCININECDCMADLFSYLKRVSFDWVFVYW